MPNNIDKYKVFNRNNKFYFVGYILWIRNHRFTGGNTW